MDNLKTIAVENARQEFDAGELLGLQEAYVLGICDGISAYAWNKDGSTFVGTTGKLLRDAIEDAMNGAYPPQRNVENVR